MPLASSWSAVKLLVRVPTRLPFSESRLPVMVGSSPREQHPPGAGGRHLEAVEHDIEGAALERGDQRAPVVLHELGLDAELRGEGLGEVDLEALELALVVGVLIYIGGAALNIRAPFQDAGVTHSLQGIVRRGRAGAGDQRQRRQERA